MKKNIYAIVLTIFSLAYVNLKAQVNYNYIFTSDSLKGFNENNAKNNAMKANCFGEEFKVSMYYQKRDFVDHKYSIGDLTHSHSSGLRRLAMLPAAPPSTINPACYNVDFETGDFTGWEVTQGSNMNSITRAGCCPTPGSPRSVIVPSVGFDPRVGALLPLTSPFGGANIARVNDVAGGGRVDRISQSFSVTPSNAIFQIAFSGVLNSGGHACFEQPYMNISVIDTTGAILPCPQIVIQAPSAACVAEASVVAGWIDSGFDDGGGDVYYHDWEIKTIDLSPYIGSYITIEISVADCIYSAHYGYGYFDCQCLPLNLNITGSFGGADFDVTPSVPVLVSLCGGSSAVFKGPDGLVGYLWDGPFGSGVSGLTTQTITTMVPGEYTLTMTPPGACFPIVKTIILNDSPDFSLSSSLTAPTCTNAVGSLTINVAGGTPVFKYKWTPAVAFSESAYGLKPGSDYSVTVSDGYGCQHTITVNVPPFPGAPDYTINPLSGLISCKNPTLDLTVVTGTTTTGGWMPTLINQTITVSAPGTYSCVLTNTTSGCKATVPIIVTSSLALPSATPNVSCGAVTTTLNAFAGAGISLGWLAPTLPSPTNVGNPGTSSAVGIFTLTATDLVSGCKQTYTVSTTPPTITLTAVPATQTITCYEKTVYLLAESSGFGYTVKWDDGSTASYINPYGVTSAGTYTATVITTGGCVATKTIHIYADLDVNAIITTPSTVIPCSTGTMALSVNSTIGVGPYTYTWMPSSPTFTSNPYIVNTGGTYSVTAFNAANGCSVTVTIDMVNEKVDASFMPDPIWGILPVSVNFNNTTVNGVTYEWDLNNGQTATTLTTSTIYNTQGTYTIILTARNGTCVDTAIRYVTVELISSLEVPNVFTPNGDGKNDLFTLKAINMADINMTVFDRWGIKMYEQTHYAHLSWDGINKGGHVVNDGTYFYVIKATGQDNKKYDLKGNITVFNK